MNQIDGKAIIFTDLHLGLKSASKSRLAIGIQAVKEVIAYASKHDIKNVLFLGDWNHVRVSTENNVLNVSYKLMQALSKHANVYCILGNHDIYMKNSTDVNSMVIFKDLPNVHVISKTEVVYVNGKKSAFVPWLGDLLSFQPEELDMMFGHFDVSHKYLVKSYIEDHSAPMMTSAHIQDDLENSQLLANATLSTKKNDAGDYVGNFVDVVNRNGIIFSGHIHGRREFIAKGRKFILVGDPYQQNLGEIGNKCGFYVLNEDFSYEFHEITSTPKHVSLRMSTIIKDVDNFDFSCVKGNIIHKVYDVDVDRILDAKVSQKINDWHPYEEILPDYEVSLSANAEIGIQNESIELIKKSKLDYVRNYISNIDSEVLKNEEIDPDKLYSMLAQYYSTVTLDEEK